MKRVKKAKIKALKLESVEKLIDEIKLKIIKLEKELKILKKNEFEILWKNSEY